MNRVWIGVVGLVVMALLVGACHLYEKRWLAVHDAYCDRVLAELEAEPGRVVDFEGVGMRPGVLEAISPHPHGGPRACILVGVAPTQWKRSDPWNEAVYLDMEGPNATLSAFTVEVSMYLRPGAPAGESPVQALERIELGPARADGVTVREQRGETTRTLVTQRGSGVHLLWLRWYPNDDEHIYIRCQAYLFGKYKAALPAFEAACAAAQSMWWE